jgi:putative photosynthetic complex assembly protein
MRAETRRPAHIRGHDEIDVPRIVLRAVIALMIVSVIAAVWGRQTGRGTLMTAPSTAAQERSLSFGDAPDGALRVTDAVSGQVVALLSSGQDGFIRGVLRGLARGRAVNRVEGGDVYVLTRWDDGRLSITDPVSGERFDLNAFGKDNLWAFARLLKSQEDRP